MLDRPDEDDGCKWLRGDRVEKMVPRGVHENVIGGESASEFFEILRHSRGLGGDRRCASAHVDRGER